MCKEMAVFIHTHIHAHTQSGGERERESTSPHIREITATWSGTLSIMLGPLKPHRCPLTCPKIPPPPETLHVVIHQATARNIKTKHIPGGNPLSPSCTWITLEIRASHPDRPVRGSFSHYFLLKELNYNSKRWTHLFFSLSLSTGKKWLHADNLYVLFF